jgi:hypothetical protein
VDDLDECLEPNGNGPCRNGAACVDSTDDTGTCAQTVATTCVATICTFTDSIVNATAPKCSGGGSCLLNNDKDACDGIGNWVPVPGCEEYDNNNQLGYRDACAQIGTTPRSTCEAIGKDT